MPDDHFGTLINFCIARQPAAALAMAGPFIQRGRVDDATMSQLHRVRPGRRAGRERLEEYVKGGGSKFILRPLCPPDRMLDQLAAAAEHVVPLYHQR